MKNYLRIMFDLAKTKNIYGTRRYNIKIYLTLVDHSEDIKEPYFVSSGLNLWNASKIVKDFLECSRNPFKYLKSDIDSLRILSNNLLKSNSEVVFKEFNLSRIKTYPKSRSKL